MESTGDIVLSWDVTQGLGEMDVREMHSNQMRELKIRATGKATDYETELGKSDLEKLNPTECNKKGI